MLPRISLMTPDSHSGGGSIEVVAPFDRSPVAVVETADASIAESAFNTAHSIFRNRQQWLPAEKRNEILRRAADLVAERRQELALGAAQEGGKPLVDSLVEVDRAVDGLRCCIETLRTQHGREIPMRLNSASADRLAMTTLEPIGPVLAYSAFNHPLNLIVHQVGPAIAAGCPVIIKPAKATPLSCLRLVGILREAGLPDEWCQPLVVDDRALTERLVTDRRVAFFSFIGSASVGWGLRSKLAPGARCARTWRRCPGRRCR